LPLQVDLSDGNHSFTAKLAPRLKQFVTSYALRFGSIVQVLHYMKDPTILVITNLKLTEWQPRYFIGKPKPYCTTTTAAAPAAATAAAAPGPRQAPRSAATPKSKRRNVQNRSSPPRTRGAAAARAKP